MEMTDGEDNNPASSSSVAQDYMGFNAASDMDEDPSIVMEQKRNNMDFVDTAKRIKERD